MPRRPGEVGLYFLMAMALNSLEELDRLARLERDDRFLPARAHAGEPADAPLLAADDLRPNARHRDVEQLLHRVLDLDLVGLAGHLEEELLLHLFRIGRDDVAAGLAQARPLLGEERTPDD